MSQEQPLHKHPTLPTELSLTKAELEAFKQLPKEEQEKQKDTKLTELKALQTKLDEAIQNAITTGDITEARRLRDELEKEIQDLEQRYGVDELDISALKLQNQAFLKETFKIWYDEAKSRVEQTPILIDPKTQDYTTLKDDIDPAKFGEYTLNPDTQNLDFENIPESKIFIPDLSALNGRPLYEVAKYIVDTYSTTHHIPGVEYWKWLIENPTKAPAKLKDRNYYFNFGSLIRNSGGRVSVPHASWNGSRWHRMRFGQAILGTPPVALSSLRFNHYHHAFRKTWR